jgi:5-(carboxyamino)imidazole ribonucleotide mutase
VSPLPVIEFLLNLVIQLMGGSVLSILQSTGGVPVATVSEWADAEDTSAQIIGSSNKVVLDKIIAYKLGLKETFLSRRV